MTTTNPVPSNDPTDLLFNAQKLDQVVNGSAQYYTDRLGVNRRTVEGISAAADVVLGGLGYAPPVAYASGISLTLTTQTVEYSGEVYAPKVASLPFTTSTWATDSAKFRLIQGVAATDLAAPGGSSMIGYTPAGTGAVATTVQSKLREFHSVKDFGAKGDGVTDDYAAIMAAINSATGSMSTSAGPTVYFPAGDYYCSQVINLKKVVRLLGEQNGHQGAITTRLKFPNTSDGIIVNRYNTNGPTGTATSSTGADGAIIEGLYVSQINPVMQACSVLDYNATHSRIIGLRFSSAFSVGDAIYVPNEQLASTAGGTISVVDRTTHCLGLSTSATGFSIGETVTGGTSGATGVVIYVGAQTSALGLKTVSGTFQANETITGGTSAKTAKVAAVYSRALDVYAMTGITGTFSGVAGGRTVAIKTSTYGTGIRLRARATIRRCIAEGWGNFGIAVVGGETGGTNANCFIVEDTSCLSTNLDGFMAVGGDANAGKVTGLNVVFCGGYGVYDSSFLGNHYFSCHISDCCAGAYRSSIYNNFSVFAGCYSEGLAQTQPFRVPRSSFGRETTVIGGDQGAGVDNPWDYFEAGYTSLGSLLFRVGDGIVATQGFDPAGKIRDTVKFEGIGAEPSVITLAVGGWGNGAYIGSSLAHGGPSAPLTSEMSTHVNAGKFGIQWSSYKGSEFTVRTITKGFVQSDITPSGGSPTRAARFYPIISGGVITGLKITDPGAGYTSAPTISGTGDWSGFTATSEVFNGRVIGTTVTASPSGLETTQITTAFTASTAQLNPGADNKASLGAYNLRWSVVYSATGAINTSDEREKQDISSLDAAESRVAVALKGLVKKFRFKDAVVSKGDSARIHVGVIAQEVMAAFQAEGLDPMRYAIVCYDEWPDEVEDVMEDVTITDESGQERKEQQPTGEKRLVRAAGNRYGIRYDQLLAFIISAL